MASNLVHESNCIISMPEFALRLQISVDDQVTAELFRIFDTVCWVRIHLSHSIFYYIFIHSQDTCGTIDFREYLLCALYLIKQSIPTFELIKIASKMYENITLPGRLTRIAIYNLLKHTTAITYNECEDIFTEIDCDRRGFITIGNWYSLFFKYCLKFKSIKNV